MHSSAPQPNQLQTTEDCLIDFWNWFNDTYPTVEDCLEELCRRREEFDELTCHFCNGKNMEKESGVRVARCSDCRRFSSRTAGTFFHHVRHPRALLARTLLLEHGITVNAFRFHKLVGVAYSTALNLFKKITTAIHNDLTEDGSIQSHSSLFLILFRKRTRETPAKAPPRAEQTEIELASKNESLRGSNRDSGSAAQMTDSAIMNRSQQERQIYALISEAEKPIGFNKLCELTRIPAGQMSAVLTMLELDEYIVRSHGDFFLAVSSKCNPNIKEAPKNLVSDIIHYILKHFDGIGRKSLQSYVADYWCAHDRSRWQSGSVIEACLRYGKVSYAEILNYVTPEYVKVLPA